MIVSCHDVTMERRYEVNFGRTAKGFEFLGYSFYPDGLSVAKKTLEKFVARCRGNRTIGANCPGFIVV